MELSVIAVKNLKKNVSFYSLYLVSVSFVLMIFFCFTSFSMNEVIMERISSDGRVETMCRTVAVFVMVFVIFYMSYSNKFFMRRRMKELGIYALLGYRKTDMLRLLALENIWICLGGLMAGVLAGSLLHKGLTGGIIAFLGLTIDNSIIPFMNVKAVTRSAIFVLLVLLVLTCSNAKVLWKATLLDMVRLEKKAEKPIRVHVINAFTGVLLLLAGYALALDIVRGKRSLWTTVGFSPIALLTMGCVVAGTALFIYSFLPYIGKKMRKKKAILYRENSIIVVPKFMHRIRSNAKSMILLILLSAGTLTILGATVLSVWYPIAALERIIPSAVEYRVTDDKQRDDSLQALKQAIGEERYQSYETTILKVTATSERLPTEYAISPELRAPGFDCISFTDYKNLLALQGKKIPADGLADGECILIKYRPEKEKRDAGASYTLTIEATPVTSVTVKETSLQNPIGFANSVATLIVSDNDYQRILAVKPETVRVISINGNALRSKETAYRTLRKAMPDNRYLVSAWQRQNELIHENSSTLLLVSFATAIFLVAAGSILYFQNISSVTYDKPDYDILGKMGYSHAMIKKTVRRQVQLYFLIPYMLGSVHSIFALICYKSALMDDLLGKSGAVLIPILFSVLLFSVIYVIYYQLTKRSCYKIVLE